MNPIRIAPLLLVLLGPCTLAGRANAESAEDIKRAQELFDEARTLMSRQQYAEACSKLEESQRLDPAPGTLLNLGHCYEASRRIAAARTMFFLTMAESRTKRDRAREQEASARAEALIHRVPRLTVVVGGNAPASLVVELDGKEVPAVDWGRPMEIDPGRHSISARAADYKTWSQANLVVEEGVTSRVEVPLLEPLHGPAVVSNDHEAESPLGRHSALVIGSASVGAIGMIVGTVFGLQSRSKHDESDEVCPSTRCDDPRAVELMDEARAAGNVSTIAFAVGALGLGAAAVFWIDPWGAERPSSTSQANLAPTLRLSGQW